MLDRQIYFLDGKTAIPFYLYEDAKSGEILQLPTGTKAEIIQDFTLSTEKDKILILTKSELEQRLYSQTKKGEDVATPTPTKTPESLPTPAATATQTTETKEIFNTQNETSKQMNPTIKNVPSQHTEYVATGFTEYQVSIDCSGIAVDPLAPQKGYPFIFGDGSGNYRDFKGFTEIVPAGAVIGGTHGTKSIEYINNWCAAGGKVEICEILEEGAADSAFKPTDKGQAGVIACFYPPNNDISSSNLSYKNGLSGGTFDKTIRKEATVFLVLDKARLFQRNLLATNSTTITMQVRFIP